MRVEYAKLRARALRWHEEVLLVKEEMRRVLQFLNWRIAWWTEHAMRFSTQRDLASLGFVAYGNLQASYLRDIALRFKKQWEDECNIKNLPDIELSFTPINVKK